MGLEPKVTGHMYYPTVTDLKLCLIPRDVSSQVLITHTPDHWETPKVRSLAEPYGIIP